MVWKSVLRVIISRQRKVENHAVPGYGIDNNDKKKT